MKITIRPDICCDECNEIYNNRMDCPVCGKENVETGAYYALYEDVVDKQECILECDACKAKFRLIGKDPYCDYEDQWERVEDEIEKDCLLGLGWFPKRF